MAKPELSEPSEGFFVLVSDYEDRFIAKQAGLRWHPGPSCRKKSCPVCKAELGKVWWTQDILKALELIEHAGDSLRASILLRAGPAAEKHREDKRRAERAVKIKKLAMNRTRAASRATDAAIEVPSPPGCEYLPYQRAAIAFGLAHPNVLIADEMGLGKTIEALGVINSDPKALRVLIVCPASLKLNWERECARWLVDRGPVGVAGKTFPKQANVVIINYDILGKWKKELKGSWDVLVADECHFVKNKEAQRSKALYAIESKRKLFLTGTPILNRPLELWTILSALAPEEFDDFWKFARRFCNPLKTNFGWEFLGATNLPELHELLSGTIMVRRTKAQVLPDLPAKRRQVIEFSSDKLGSLIAGETEAWLEHKRRLKELRALRRKGANSGAEELAEMRAGINTAFGDLSKLRQKTALAKVPLVVEHLKSVLEETEKVVVFAHHRAVIAELYEAFSTTAVTLTGEDSVEARQAAVDSFQGDTACRMFIGSITASGLGLTLTAAAHVVFAELDWVPANLTQAEDRTHRIGQTDSVLIQHLVLQDSLDARMIGTLLEKQQIMDQVVDGTSQDELFGEIQD